MPLGDVGRRKADIGHQPNDQHQQCNNDTQRCLPLILANCTYNICTRYVRYLYGTPGRIDSISNIRFAPVSAVLPEVS